VYDAVRVILEEKEKASNISYESLHAQYKAGVKFDLLRGFMIEVENEIIPHGYLADNVAIRCAIFFWVVNCVKVGLSIHASLVILKGFRQPSAVPATEIFAQQNDISVKKFLNVLDFMNDHCKSIRRKIHSLLRGHSTSPIKSSATPVTLRQSPRKLVSLQDEPASQDSSARNLALGNANTGSQESPLRRSTRNAYSPRIGSISPTKSTVPLPWKKGPKRELPSKDSPTKRITMDEQRSDIEERVIRDELPQTPSKRRKLESPLKSSPRNMSTLVALGEPGSSLDLPASTECQPKSFPSTPRRSSPLKQTRIVASSMDTPSSSDASESEQPHARGRFRPVYLDHRQWTARDPRLARIWKRSERLMTRSKTKNNRVGAKSSV